MIDIESQKQMEKYKNQIMIRTTGLIWDLLKKESRDEGRTMTSHVSQILKKHFIENGKHYKP